MPDSRALVFQMDTSARILPFAALKIKKKATGKGSGTPIPSNYGMETPL